MKRWPWFAAILCCIPSVATSQSDLSSQNAASREAAPASLPLTLIPRTHEERERSYRAEHHIVLNVLVTNESDKPVSGLKPDDFILMDNRQPQKLASFREVNGSKGVAPVHIILMLDALNNTRRSIAHEINEIDKYLELHQGHLSFPTSLGVLTSSGIRMGQSTSDGATLLAESRTLFEEIRPFICDDSKYKSILPVSGHGDSNIAFSTEKSDDGDCLNKRFTISLTQLQNLATAQKDTLGRVILIWIGPGWPHLSGPEFERDSEEIKQNFFDHIVELSGSLREAQVTVDAVYSQDMSRNAKGNDALDPVSAIGVSTEKLASASGLALQAIAQQSGGRILEDKRIADSIAKCVADAQTYYSVSFDSIPASKPDEYHSLQVHVNNPGVRVFTTASYYGQP